MGITKNNFDAIESENYELLYVGELSELQEQTQGEMEKAIWMMRLTCYRVTELIWRYYHGIEANK